MANETVSVDEELVRFTLAEFPQRTLVLGTCRILCTSAKICEIVAVAMGMLIGIFALFSGVIERQCKYCISVQLITTPISIQHATSGDLFWPLSTPRWVRECWPSSYILCVYIDQTSRVKSDTLFCVQLINSDTFVGDAEAFTTRWTILLPAAAMALNIPLKVTIGVLSTKLMRNLDEYSTS